MSGTASMGSWDRAAPPTKAAMAVRSRTSQRLCTAQSTIGAIIGSILVASFALPEFGLEREAVDGGDLLAALEAGANDYAAAAIVAERDRHGLKAGPRPHETDGLVFHRLDGGGGHSNGAVSAAARQRDRGRHRFAHAPL